MRPITAFTLILLLVFASCGDSASKVTPEETGGRYGSGVNLEGLDGTAAPGADGGATAAPGRPAGQAASAPPRGSNNAPTLAVPGSLADDDDVLGCNATVYLRGDRYNKLVIEFNAVRGFEPSAEALSTLRSRLTGLVNKPGGIEFLPVKNFSSGDNSYTIDDVKRTEKARRTRFSDPNGGTAVIHVLYLNGRAEPSGPLGIAYGASSVVIFQQSVRSVSSPLSSGPNIEKAALVHEIGHVLGLVNIGYTSPRDHADKEHPSHSKHQDSVMYYAVDSDLISSIFGGAPPPSTFHEDDLGDLRDRRDGRLPDFLSQRCDESKR